MSMRTTRLTFSLIASLLALALAGCGAGSADSSSATPASQGAATPKHVSAGAKGRVLLTAQGSPMQTDVTTRSFTARKAWVVSYHMHCGPLSVGPGGKVLQVAGINPRHPNGDELGIIYAMGHLSSGHSQPVAPGAWKLRILAGGCSWRVVAQEE